MNKFLLVLTMMFSSILSFAGDYQEMIFSGQTQDRLTLSTVVQETRYRTESQAYSCVQRVPYQQRICRTETRYQNRCTQSPGRRVCTNRRGRRTCRTTPGRRVCRQVPVRRNVCRIETRYRTENRTCYRNVEVPYTETIADINAEVNVQFQTAPGIPNHSFGIELFDNGEINTRLLDDMGYQVNISPRDPQITQNGIYKTIKQQVIISIR